jgi:hypothetical protein
MPCGTRSAAGWCRPPRRGAMAPRGARAPAPGATTRTL